EDGIRDDLVTGVQTCALPIFHQTENISRWILCVGQPTHFRNRHLRHANASAKFLYFLDRLIQRRDGNRVDRTGTLTFSRTQEPRSEERRVGKEGSLWRASYQQ